MSNDRHLMTNYAPLEVTFDHGKGSYLWDTEGRQYLDALSGIAVCGIGHAHPAVAEAVARQAQTLVHTSNLYHITKQQQLADALCELSGQDRVFFSNSGAEANEAAIKMARMYGHSRRVKTPTIIVTEQAFHGRTMATLTATGSRKVQAGFEPLLKGFVRAPYNDIEALRNIAANNADVVAVMVEPIQGEGGIRIPGDNYLQELRQLCDDNDWLLILDEVQTGMGRTGKWFAFQHADIQPDILTLAKSLANGVPIGACLSREHVAELMKPGSHGSTFGGNPLSCAAGLAVIATIRQENLVEHAASMGTILLDRLQNALGGIAIVREVRGKGLMIGIELAHKASELVAQGLAEGILFSVQNENVIRLLPPINLSNAEADELVSKMLTLISRFSQQQAA